MISLESTMPLALLTLLGMALGTDDERAKEALQGADPNRKHPIRLELAGTVYTPHLRAEGLHYGLPTEGPLGARIQIFVRNAAVDPPVDAVMNSVDFDRNYPLHHLLDGSWSWHDTPNLWSNHERVLPPGALSVWTINAVVPTWKQGHPISSMVTDWSKDSIAFLKIPTMEQKRFFTAVTFLGENARPNRAILHLRNDADTALKVERVRFWLPREGNSYRVLHPGPWENETSLWPGDGIIPPGEQGVVEVHTDPLPLSYAAVEMECEDPSGITESLWAHVRVKREEFAISAGWVNNRARDGQDLFLHETFLKALKFFHVDTAHIGMIQGYNDQPDTGSLYDLYPIKQFGALRPLSLYDKEEMLPHVHGVEFLGEPQLPFGSGHKTPQQVLEALGEYERTCLPTTVTLSDEATFRHYAGLSDFPHYDAYRICAPAADVWRKYDRWDGQRIGWGAPMEGIGELCRVLRAMSRPKPTAIWSQAPHDGWYPMAGRTRTSPTAEELRSQAYHALATRITSLYWFNPSLQAMVKFRDTLEELQRVGLEIRLLETYYLEGAAYRHERVLSKKGRLDWELASIVTGTGALLFALDLDYAPDDQDKVFRFGPPRNANFSFDLPLHLRSPQELFRVDAQGLYEVNWKKTKVGVSLQDKASLVSIYVLSKDAGTKLDLKQRWLDLLEQEISLQFDPVNRDEDFEALISLLP